MQVKRNDDGTFTMQFSTVAGAVIRGQVKRWVRNTCFNNGIQCQIEEDKGFLESTYYFTLRADGSTLKTFIRAYNDMLDYY